MAVSLNVIEVAVLYLCLIFRSMFGKALGDMRTLKVWVLWFPLPTMLFSTSFGGNKDVNGNANMPK